MNYNPKFAMLIHFLLKIFFRARVLSFTTKLLSLRPLRQRRNSTWSLNALVRPTTLISWIKTSQALKQRTAKSLSMTTSKLLAPTPKITEKPSPSDQTFLLSEIAAALPSMKSRTSPVFVSFPARSKLMLKAYLRKKSHRPLFPPSSPYLLDFLLDPHSEFS